MLRSLRFRLLLLPLLIVLAVAGGVAFAGTQVTARTFHGYEMQRGMMRDARFERALAEIYARQGGWAAVQPEIERLGQITGERVTLTDPQGIVVADSAGERIGQPVAPGQDAPALRVTAHGVTVGLLYFNPSGPLPGAAFLASANRTLLLIAIAAGLGAVLLVLGFSRRILAPVDALTRAARHMAAGDLNQRVETTAEDEIGDLARAFNSMADGLAHLEQLRRNMVSDVAHELRTPLTNIRGYLEALRDGVVAPDPALIASLHEEALLLSRLVDDLQELSLADAGQLKLQRELAAPAGLVAQAVHALRLRAEAGGVQLQVDLPPALPDVDVDARRVGQVLRNLLENALAHTPAGGEVRVTARADGTWVELCVQDSGSGITVADLPHVFDRFYRADRSRSRATGGAGLGLAIVQQLVHAHGGQVQAASVEGEGSTFCFTLPVAQPEGT